MPAIHGLPLPPSGVNLDGTEPLWVDKEIGGIWYTYQFTLAEVAQSGFGEQAANQVFAGPISGIATTPLFRALAWDDLPLPSELSGTSGIAGADLVAVEQGGVMIQVTVAQLQAAVGGGTVTSVDVAVPAALLTTSGGPITGAGTITLALADQNAAKVLVGPASGADAAPTFRYLVWNDDIPLISTLPSTSGLDGDEHVVVEKGGTFIQTTARFLATIMLSLVNVFQRNQSVAPVITNNITGSYTPDASLTNNWEINQGAGNLTLANPTNLTAGMVLNFQITQDAVGGRTISLGNKFLFGGGTVPTWITTTGAVNFISGYVNSAGNIICGGVAGAA